MDSLPVNDKMENFIIAFDIDGTLISNINEGVVQERRVHGQVYPFDAANTQVVEFLILCSRIFKNVKVIVWSAGGQEYAQQWVERLQLEKYVWRTYSKSQYQELSGNYKVIAIDDIHRTKLGNVANLIVRIK